MEGLIPITSRDNQYLKLARSLKSRKERAETGCFLLEGLRLAGEALNSCWPLSYALLSEETLNNRRLADILTALRRQGVPVYVVPPHLLQQAADTEHSQGLLLVARLPQTPPAQLPPGDFFILADHLADPGNLGAIMRTAWAAGADALLLTADCADPFSPKTTRASMGAVLRLPLLRCDSDNELLSLLQARGLHLLAAEAGGDHRYDQADLRRPLAWLLGAEATGLSPFWREAAASRVYLPMALGAESLNVAATAAILLYETAAQRGFPKGNS